VQACVRGLKGQNYEKLVMWYKTIMQYTGKLIDLLELESHDPNALNMTFRVLKVGLLSNNADLATICSRCINKVCNTIYT